MLFSSLKTGWMMPCENRLERDSCLDLEFDESVATYRTQPFGIRIRGGRTYTPDSVQMLKSGEVAVREVKFTGELEDSGLTAKLQWIRGHFARQGIGFSVRTEKDLQQKPLIENRKIIYRASHIPCTPFAVERAVELLQEQEAAISLHDFRDLCGKDHLSPLMPEKLLLHGYASYEQYESLTEHSLIGIGEEQL